jgi:hypothetical protein
MVVWFNEPQMKRTFFFGTPSLLLHDAWTETILIPFLLPDDEGKVNFLFLFSNRTLTLGSLFCNKAMVLYRNLAKSCLERLQAFS